MKKIIITIIVMALLPTFVSAARPIENADGTITIQKVKAAEESADVVYYGDPVDLTDDEFDLLCRVLCLEDGGESEYSQKCVASAIYNRLISGLWGSSISDVLYAANQFEVMPYVATANPSELTISVVREVFLDGRSVLPARVMYFRTDYYFGWARPELTVGNVYFSSSWWYQ